jgi:DNA replication protein DnaC
VLLMDETIYPDSFIALAKISERLLVVEPPEINHPDDCSNCGGIEFMYYFEPAAGPYKHPSATAKGALRHIEGEGWYVGNLVGEDCPVCSGSQRHHYLTKISGLEDEELKIRLEDFKALDGKEEAKVMAGMILNMTPSPVGFYTFWGDFGTGKTTLMMAVCNGFRIAGVTAAYRRMADILAEVRESFGDNSREAAEEILRRYANYKVLAIDEIDRVHLTSWSQETVFRFIDGRYQRMQRNLTLLATNTEPDEMSQELGYLSSRMTAGQIIHVGGEDIRPAIGLQQKKEMFDE